jgi:prepilin-type N-terminal cleavage/methylation domain-containing protein
VKSTTPRSEGFTLLELLVVIAIIGIIAAIAAPTMNTFKPNVIAAASRQLLDDVSRARQLAISQRTTVYMIFVPPDYWTDPSYASLPPHYQEEAKKLADRQFTGYTFVSLRSLGDQPGRSVPKYLGPWKTLPEGVTSPLNSSGDHYPIYDKQGCHHPRTCTPGPWIFSHHKRAVPDGGYAQAGQQQISATPLHRI